jgi:ABC-type glycerol-3-phosphate transport system substrate-binding protein
MALRKEASTMLRRHVLGRFGAAGATLAATAIAAACGAPGTPSGGAPGAAGGPVGNPAQPTTVTVWHAWDGPREPLMKTILERLKQQYPNLTVEQSIVQMWQDANVQKFGAAVAAGTAPDVTMLYDIYIPQYGPETRTMQALDDWVKRDKITLKQVFYDADVEGLQMEGKTWLLPHTAPIQPVNVAYNKDLALRAGFDFDKSPPQSWDELLQAATKLTLREGSGLAQLGADLTPSAGLFESYMGTVKAAAFSADGKKATFADAKAIEVLEWLVRARQALGGRQAIDALRDANRGQALFEQARKQAIVHHNYSIYFSWSQQYPDLKFGAFPIVPQQKGAEMALPHKQAWGWGMVSAAREKDAAWLLVKKMTHDEDGGGYLQVAQGRPSPIRKVNESGEFKQNNPYWPTVVKTLEQRWKRPPAFIPPDAAKAFADAVAKVSSEEVAVRSGLNDGAQLAQTALDNYWATKRK